MRSERAVVDFAARTSRERSFGIPGRRDPAVWRVTSRALDSGRLLRADGPVDPGVRRLVPVADQRAERGDRQSRPPRRGHVHRLPAFDIVARTNTQVASFGRWRSRLRGLPEFTGELPASTLDRGDRRHPVKVRSKALRHHRRQPGAVDTRTAARLEPRDGRSRIHLASIDIYVNETTRHADVILPPTTGARVRPLRHRLPHARGPQHCASYSAAPLRSRRRGYAPRLADLPRIELRLRLEDDAEFTRFESGDGILAKVWRRPAQAIDARSAGAGPTAPV